MDRTSHFFNTIFGFFNQMFSNDSFELFACKSWNNFWLTTTRKKVSTQGCHCNKTGVFDMIFLVMINIMIPIFKQDYLFPVKVFHLFFHHHTPVLFGLEQEELTNLNDGKGKCKGIKFKKKDCQYRALFKCIIIFIFCKLKPKNN